jgi:hypothetical protein
MNTNQLKLTYIGGPTALLEFAGLRLLTDPTFDAPGGEYTTGPVTLRKLAGPALSSDAIGPLETIRLVFDQPQRVRCICLVFEENETGRTQEFVLRWSPDGGSSLKEIVRQQWNFSPPKSIREVEEYQVELSNVTVLELLIKPNIGGGVARASLKNLRLS